jgi:hypothetical protein
VLNPWLDFKNVFADSKLDPSLDTALKLSDDPKVMQSAVDVARSDSLAILACSRRLSDELQHIASNRLRELDTLPLRLEAETLAPSRGNNLMDIEDDIAVCIIVEQFPIGCTLRIDTADDTQSMCIHDRRLPNTT